MGDLRWYYAEQRPPYVLIQYFQSSRSSHYRLVVHCNDIFFAYNRYAGNCQLPYRQQTFRPFTLLDFPAILVFYTIVVSFPSSDSFLVFFRRSASQSASSLPWQLHLQYSPSNWFPLALTVLLNIKAYPILHARHFTVSFLIMSQGLDEHYANEHQDVPLTQLIFSVYLLPHRCRHPYHLFSSHYLHRHLPTSSYIHTANRLSSHTIPGT